MAAWGGMILALATWLIVCQAEFGEITIDNLGTLNPNLAGNIVALLSSALIHAAFSLANPQNYDFESMGKIDTWQVLASVVTVVGCWFHIQASLGLRPGSRDVCK